MEHSRPVVLYEAQPIVIVNYPFSLRLNLIKFDLSDLFIYPGKVESVEKTNLKENASEISEIVIVSEADHSTQNVFLRLLLMMVEQISDVEKFWDCDKSFEDTSCVWISIWPIHVKCKHFGELR